MQHYAVGPSYYGDHELIIVLIECKCGCNKNLIKIYDSGKNGLRCPICSSDDILWYHRRGTMMRIYTSDEVSKLNMEHSELFC